MMKMILLAASLLLTSATSGFSQNELTQKPDPSPGKHIVCHDTKSLHQLLESRSYQMLIVAIDNSFFKPAGNVTISIYVNLEEDAKYIIVRNFHDLDKTSCVINWGDSLTLLDPGEPV